MGIKQIFQMFCDCCEKEIPLSRVYKGNVEAVMSYPRLVLRQKDGKGLKGDVIVDLKIDHPLGHDEEFHRVSKEGRYCAKCVTELLKAAVVVEAYWPHTIYKDHR